MSDPFLPDDPRTQFDPAPEGAEPAIDYASMDPAQQSLADALRITFRVLQLVMILLVALFLGSGFQTVEESERGIKLVFGRVTRDDVPPGVTWNWPFPIGEVVRVKTGQQAMYLESSFGPRRGAAEAGRPIGDIIRNYFQLNPEEVGSVLTADGGIAHTWWRAIWRREDAASNMRSILPEQEQEIVRRAVERGVVRAVAEIGIDDLLKQGASGNAVVAGETAESTLAGRIRSVAQASLDSIDAGIRIEQVVLEERAAPGRVFTEFALVASAESQASTRREEAEKEAREILNSTAGEAHAVMLDLIDDYERAIELRDAPAADAALATFNRLLESEVVEVDGRGFRATGDVTAIIDAARQYRTDIVANAKNRAAAFQVKLAQFRQQPELFVAREWGPAYEAFSRSGAVEIFPVPPGSAPEIWLNRDPEIQEEMERARNAREAEESLNTLDERRMREVRRQRELDRQKKREAEAGQ